MNELNIFSPGKIGKRNTRNRFVVQPMEGNDARDGGNVSVRAIERYKRLAKGRWGIVFAEAMSVTRNSLARIHGLVLNHGNIDSFKRLVDEFKSIDPEALLIFQISHSGTRCSGSSHPVTVSPALKDEFQYLSTSDIDKIREKFVVSCLLAEEAGADGVDIKMCHGYLGAELLRPMNTRKDKWGGDFLNRTRFLTQIAEELVQKRKNERFLLGSRISLYEGIRGGCGTSGQDGLVEDLTEMLSLVRMMETLGMDFVNVSAGIPGLTSEITRPTRPSRFLYLQHLRYQKEVKNVLKGMAVIGSGYSILKEDAASIGSDCIAKGITDFAGFGRQSFADPLFPAKLENGQAVNYCTACSGCSRLMAAQKNDGCVIYDEYYRTLEGT